MLYINVMTQDLRVKLTKRRWKDRNPEAVKEGCRVYHKRHLEKERARKRKWAVDNPDRAGHNKREWEIENPEKHKLGQAVRTKRWAEKHPEKVLENVRKWRRDNPEKATSQRHLRIAREHAAEGAFTGEQWFLLKVFYGNQCLCCRRCEADLQILGMTLTPDHILPLSKGGANSIDNIQPLCHGKGGCNNKKSAKFIDYRTQETQ